MTTTEAIELGPAAELVTEITYAIEHTDRGWVIWRSVPGRVTTRVPHVHPRTSEEAHAFARQAQRADMAAASRLGLGACATGEAGLILRVFRPTE